MTSLAGFLGSVMMTASQLQLNGPNLIRLPCENSNQTFLNGFWRWVDILSLGNYVLAVESLYWEKAPWTPEELENRIRTFFSKTERFFPVIPNQRLINVINENSKIEWREHGGWGLAQIPMTNQPEKSKDDDVLLMGLAASFFVRKLDEDYVLQFEIFHL
jgi:hypothetical protein